MKEMMKWIGKILFYAMAIALITYAASRTLDFVNSTLDSGDQIIGYLALFATTGGAIAWLSVYLHNSKGIAQKGISLVMIVIDVLGEIALFTVDTLMRSGMNGLTAQMAPEEIRLTVLAMSLLIGLNIIATFAYHIMDADNMAAMEDHFSDWTIDLAVQKAKREKATSIAQTIADEEAEKYGVMQLEKDRTDRALPEKSVIDALGDLFKQKTALAASDTVGIPELKPEILNDEKKYLCQWCGATHLESELIQSIHGKHKICGKLGCGGFVEEKAPSASFQKKEEGDWSGGLVQGEDGNWHGV